MSGEFNIVGDSGIYGTSLVHIWAGIGKLMIIMLLHWHSFY
jgi:hypothetical protein